uniref:DUF1758 domain-containing protein n=1 Tax=Amphimedon queenslandica TaxID=400682 RepID=A0A1X7TWL4_AMPQE
MATDLGHLKSVRAGHKGAVSRKMTDLNALLVSTPVDRDSLERIKLALERKLDLLNKLSEDIVAALTDEGEIIAEIETAELVSDDIEEALSKIKRALDPPRSTPPPPIIPPPSHPTSPVPLTSHAASPSPPPVDPLASSPPVTAPTSTLRVKLPELSLHPFDGNFANWFTFWDTYKAAIHDNAELSDIGKFTYLISLLRHSAKEAIAGLSLTAANYREAIEILCKRFGDRTQIRANHMEVLMSLEPVMSSQNLSGLRRLYDTVETNIRGLKSLGVDRESYGTLLSPVILKKLPQDLRLIISRQVADDEWNLDSILRILLSEIEARERAGISNNSKPRRDRERPTGVNLYTESSQAVRSNPTSTLHVENENAVLLQTACAVVFNPTNHDFHEEVRVILDCGSQRSYITNSLKKRLQLVSEGKKAMSIMTFGSTKVRNETCDLVRVGVRAKESDFELRLLSVPHICSPIASMPVETCRSKYSYLRELDLADTLPDGELEILIGSDYYWKVVTGERIQGSHGPVAIYTRLGWVLSGSVPHFDGSYSTNLITHVLRVDSGPTFRELDKHLKAFWELESLGIRDSEDIVHEQFCSIVTLREGRYEVSLPWKDSFSTIPDHFELCSRRLNSLLRRLR